MSLQKHYPKGFSSSPLLLPELNFKSYHHSENRKDKFMNIDYKALDTRKIRDYIDASGRVVTVDDIIQNSGADKLRVYPALFELEQDGYIEVAEREELGAPATICRKRGLINER